MRRWLRPSCLGTSYCMDAYDVPFLGPTGARAAKDVTDEEVTVFS